MKKVYINRQWQGGADPVTRDGDERAMTKHGDGPSVSAQAVRPRGFWDRGTWDRGNTVNFDLNRSGTKAIPMPFPSGQCHQFKELPHNARGPLAGELQPLAACKNLDYPPGNLRFLRFAID